jgi:hypothetical protein
MNCKESIEFMQEYCSGDISEHDLVKLKQHLDECEECRRKFMEIEKLSIAFDHIPDLKPGSDSGEFLDDIIRQEYNNAGKGIRFTGIHRYILIPAGIAASIILFFGGFFTGKMHHRQYLEDQEIIALRKEVNETKNLMILNLLEQQSASKRIMAANYAEELEEIKPEVMDALVYSLNNDYSANVRLAALEALSRYTDYPFVRFELIKCFENEKDPIIQLNMINMMVLLNEKSSAYIMQKLVNDEHTPKIVREQAKKGLEILL